MGGFLEWPRRIVAWQTCFMVPTIILTWVRAEAVWPRTIREANQFRRSIHNLESSYFRTKFEGDLDKFTGRSGIGIISDTDAQPIIINSHLGRFAIVTVAKICNIDELERELLDCNMHFAELSSGTTNQTELIALLITQG